MFIPAHDGEKWALYERLIQACFATQSQRTVNYNRYRNFYLWGTDQGTPEDTVNQIYPHLDQLFSFLYSSETTRFSTSIGASVDRVQLRRVPVLNSAVNQQWHASNGDIVFNSALEWSHVYGTEIVKGRWKDGQIEPHCVDPHDFGVLREDTSQLSRQEAFAQQYWVSKGELETQLKNAEHPRINEILSAISAQPRTTREERGQSNLIISSALPATGSGLLTGSYSSFPGSLFGTSMYSPKVDEPLVKMFELYVYDSYLNDFRVITTANPYIVIFDRPIERMFVPGEIPFVQVCPIPTSDYFYGRSQVERLIPLQMKYNKRDRQVDRMMDMQANPPTEFSGYAGITDEIEATFNTPGGYVSNDNPGAKANRMAPELPDDLYAELGKIKDEFLEALGLTNVTQGKGEAGVRSTGHANQLAKLGSSRAKKRAMVIEDSLEKIGTLYLQMMQRYDGEHVYRDTHNDEFIAAQFTDDYVVKVDAHSNSPIFTEDLEQKAIEALKLQVITKEQFLRMYGLPSEEVLVEELKTKIEPAEAKAHEEENELKVAELRVKQRSAR